MPMVDGRYIAKTRTVTKPIEEWLADEVDWSYDFEGESWDKQGVTNPEVTSRAREALKKCVPGCEVMISNWGWLEVTAVGMAAQWPWWKPRPTVNVKSRSLSQFCPQWIDWLDLRSVRDKPVEKDNA